MQNWKLVCSACGAEFPAHETIDIAAGHTQQEHPELDNAHFSTVWKGKGPAPRKFPSSSGRGRR